MKFMFMEDASVDWVKIRCLVDVSLPQFHQESLCYGETRNDSKNNNELTIAVPFIPRWCGGQNGFSIFFFSFSLTLRFQLNFSANRASCGYFCLLQNINF